MEFRRWEIIDMRTRTALVLFFLSALAVGLLTFVVGVRAEENAGALAGKEEKKPEFAWRDFGSGLAEARKYEKAVLVDIYTDWCGWCKRMDKNTYRDAEVVSYINESFVPIKLNAESNTRTDYLGDEYSYRQLASGFRVRGYPTTLFLAADGSHITTVPGYMPPSTFLTVLRFIGEKHYEEMSFEEFRKQAEPSSRK